MHFPVFVLASKQLFVYSWEFQLSDAEVEALTLEAHSVVIK